MITLDELIEGGLTKTIAKFIRPKYYSKFPKGFVPGTRVRVIDKQDYLYPCESIIVDHLKLQKEDLRDKNLDGIELDKIRKRWSKQHLFIEIPDSLHDLTRDRGYHPLWLIEISCLEVINANYYTR